jgi:hypothetical protein
MERPIVLGFDLRRPIADQAPGWPQERRSSFLIRPDAPSPLSVDRSVWPTFEAGRDVNSPLHLWASLREIPGVLAERAERPEHSRAIIEIAVVPRDEESSKYWKAIFSGRPGSRRGLPTHPY